MKKCQISDCSRKYLAKGFCAFHYKRNLFGRDLTSAFRPKILLPKNHPVYVAWVNMKTRCDNPKATQYLWYGGRGITYCFRWQKFENFYVDMFSTWEPGLTLDRIQVNEHYGPENCRWATRQEQSENRNKRGYLTRGRSTLVL